MISVIKNDQITYEGLLFKQNYTQDKYD